MARGIVLYHRGGWAEAAESFEDAIVAALGSEVALLAELRAWFFSASIIVPTLRPRALELINITTNDDLAAEGLAGRVACAQLAVFRTWRADPTGPSIELAERAWGNGDLLSLEGAEGGTWNLVTGVLTACGEPQRSEAIATEVMAFARRRGSSMAFATASLIRATAIHYQGRVEDVLSDVEQALAAGGPDWDTYAGGALWIQAESLVEQGDLASAQAALRRLDDPRPLSIERPCLLHARGRLHAARAEHQSALEDFLETGRLLSELFGIQTDSWVPWRTSAAEAANALGDREVALALCDEALELAHRAGASGPIGRALRVKALVQDGEDSIRLFDDSAEILAPSPHRLEHARTLVEHGAFLRRAGERRRSLEKLRAGLRLAAREEATALSRRAREELAASGIRTSPTATRSGVSALTPSERRVVDMAAEGLSNREIAQALFLTVKTVETHLAHAYPKLKIDSRRGLTNALAGTAPREPL
jgi:ATP/maltotriose-dependent transcriptional regulator MalT